MSPTETDRQEKETGRVEAFSDGVFAIAITLLVLDLKIPYGVSDDLSSTLLKQWPTFVAFLRDSYAEIRHKTTWPDFPQTRQASIAIIIFVLAIGLMISLLDVLLNLVLVNFLPSLIS